MNVARKDLPSALCSVPVSRVKELSALLIHNIDVRDIALPQSGLGLLSMSDGAFHESFFIGEIPVARSEVILRIVSGEEYKGGAVIVDDRAQLARAIAILDAVWAGRLTGWEDVENLVQLGLVVRSKTDSERKKLLAVTRVDFSLLGEEDEEDEE
jgi:alpha-D-ribose 1-methylphosphonate 5-triphosphate synthase subunit PhnG